MQHADVNVRLLAASHSLGWAPGEASTVLEALEQERGLHALTAKYTLKAYRSGKLNLTDAGCPFDRHGARTVRGALAVVGGWAGGCRSAPC